MSENQNVIEYRLDKIDEQLQELKHLVLATKLQQKDIDELKARVDSAEQEIGGVKKNLAELEKAPLKNKADRWQFILDYVFKTAITIILGVFLAKVGLK